MILKALVRRYLVVLSIGIIITGLSGSYAISTTLIPAPSDVTRIDETVRHQNMTVILRETPTSNSANMGNSSDSVASINHSVVFSSQTTIIPEIKLEPSNMRARPSNVTAIISHTTASSTQHAFLNTEFTSRTFIAEGTVVPQAKLEPDPVRTSEFTSRTFIAEGTVVPQAKLEPDPVRTSEFTSRTFLATGTERLGADQRIVSDTETEVVFDFDQVLEELVIKNATASLSKITVTEHTDNPRINFKNILVADDDGNRVVKYAAGLDIDVIFTDIRANVTIPSNTTITGPPDWNGVVKLPVFAEKFIDTDQGTVTSVLSIGFDGDMLELDRPARIEFDGKAGQNVGFLSGDDVVMIETACDADDSETVTLQLDHGGECKTSVGSDLVVWTFHFTDFFTVTDVPGPSAVPVGTPPKTAPAEPPRIPPSEEPGSNTGRSSGGGGGGGGGGGHPSLATAATNPDMPRTDTIYFDSVQWDCNAKEVTVVVGPGNASMGVSLRTPQLGAQSMVESGAGQIPDHKTFVGRMHDEDDYVKISAILLSGRDVHMISESVDMDLCTGSKTYQRHVATPPVLGERQLPDNGSDAQKPAPRTDGAIQSEPAPLAAGPAPHPPQDIPDDSTPTSTIEPAIESAIESVMKPPAQPPAEPATMPEPGTSCGPGTTSKDGICVVLPAVQEPANSGPIADFFEYVARLPGIIRDYFGS